MSKKQDRISINKFESILTDNVVTIPLAGAEDVTVMIKKNLSLEEMVQFVSDIVESCIDRENGEFIPESMDFVLKSGLLTKYANFTLPSSYDKQYMLVCGTNAVDQVWPHINQVQFMEIKNAAEKKINFYLNTMAGAVHKRIDELASQLESVVAMYEKAFEGFDADDMKDMVKNLGSIKDLDEESLVNAVLSAQASKEHNNVIDLGTMDVK